VVQVIIQYKLRSLPLWYIYDYFLVLLKLLKNNCKFLLLRENWPAHSL